MPPNSIDEFAPMAVVVVGAFFIHKGLIAG